jgi:mono/diheme cytochrome c family protein
MRGWTQWIVLAALATGCGDNGARPAADAAPDGTTQTKVERGQYIMNVLANCTFCHTPLLPNGSRDLDHLLSGVDCFADITSPTFQDDGNGIGCVSTRNLTPDATGLKNATDEQIKNAFRNGIRTDGKKLSPIMPYWIFHNMSDDDADAVVAYLRSIPPVQHTVKPNEPPWSDFNDGNLPQPPFIAEGNIPLPRGGANNASAMRGRYLSSMAGLCVDCHTPDKSDDFQNALIDALTIDQTKFFAGGRLFPKGALGLLDPSYPAFVVTRNITPDATGLMGWTRQQITNSIAIGKDPDGKAVCAATHGGLISPYAALTDQDLTDIVEYVYNLPPLANDTAAKFCPAPPIPDAGGAETGTQCGNGVDDDGDTVPDDGCLCGNCQGPVVP